ncbi:MAG: hypothetical protein LBI36_00280 [Oscillospiraceae bacterium]|jgi:flagellin-like hook-associated protein FlgL|nr:hypothetical protein [Oscillospiraceae bacterium]
MHFNVGFNVESYIIAQDSTNDYSITNDYKDLSFEDFVKTYLFDDDTDETFDEKAQYFADRVASALEAGFKDEIGDSSVILKGEFTASGEVKFYFDPYSTAPISDPPPTDARGFRAVTCVGGSMTNQFSHEFLHVKCSQDPTSRIDLPVEGPGYWTEVITGIVPDGQGLSKSFSNGGGGLTLQIGADNKEEQRVAVNIKAMDSSSIGIADIGVKTVREAQSYMDRINGAITAVSSQRASLGAMQNRLERTINSLTVSTENTTSSEAQIRDTDMADEIVALTNPY